MALVDRSHAIILPNYEIELFKNRRGLWCGVNNVQNIYKNYQETPLIA